MTSRCQPDHPLLTDLYELTMMQSYFDSGMNDTASFELFARKLPPGRNFFVAAGLEQVLDYLRGLRFDDEDIAALSALQHFSAPFLASLKTLRFTGDVDAMPEGTVFFPDEPLLRITAPLREAQLVESRVLNLIHYQTIVASKAVRVALHAPGKLLVDFGLRRAHGAEAGLLSARAAYLAGFTGTATLLAGVRFHIPVFGTMAHSFVLAHRDEAASFAAFARSQPRNATLLIDTYDTEAGAAKVATLATALRAEGILVKAVRLDSGDLGAHAVRVRAILDAAGHRDIAIFASGNLDEYRVRDLLRSGAPIDGFGVGTRVNTSADAPYLDCAYKLVEYAGRPRRKRSEGKANWPGRKQVFREYGDGGIARRDIIAIDGDACAGTPLLRPVMRSGKRVSPPDTLEQARTRLRNQWGELDGALHELEDATPYPVIVGEHVLALAQQADADSLRGQTASPAG